MRRVSILVAILIGFMVMVGSAAGPRSATKIDLNKPRDVWRETERLVNEGKLEAAHESVTAILAQARAAKDSPIWTEALIRRLRLRTALHGPETAVREFQSETWPEATFSQAMLNLYLGQAYANYAQAYSWEIRQRERQAGESRDLKTMTMDELFAQSQEAFGRAWAGRQSLGEKSKKSGAGFFQENTYPDHIRPTLRDAVTYLFAGLLADSSLWNPAHSNELYTLPLAELLGRTNQAQSNQDLNLSDQKIHPLVKAAFVLKNLEAWHAERNEAEAALEARLTLIQILGSHFSTEQDKIVFRQALESTLSSGADKPWWSMGMAQLAEHIRNEPDEESLIRAMAVARKGWTAHPQSPGGQRCLHLIRDLEAPDVRLEAMAIDGLNKRSLAVTHKNLGKLFFRAYALTLEEVLASRNYGLMPEQAVLNRIVSERRPVIAWEAFLPATPDYRPHRTYVTPPLSSPGLYAVLTSVKPDFSRPANRVQAVLFTVSDLVLESRFEDSRVEVTARSGALGEIYAGAQITLYRFDWQKGHRPVGDGRTNRDGRIVFEPKPYEPHFLVAKHQGQVTVDGHGISTYPRQSAKTVSAGLIYTDRSIYRPGQKVLWKAVAYEGSREAGSYHTRPGAEFTVNLVDVNGQTVLSSQVTANAFGSASGEFVIPTGRALGRWEVRTSLPGSAAVRVEEYKRPTFDVTMNEPETPPRLNHPVTISGKAVYAFGLPVDIGQVRWKIIRTPVWPWWMAWRGMSVQAQTLTSGTANLDAQGNFSLTFTAAGDERLGREASFAFDLSVDVTDQGGETRSAGKRFRLGIVAVEATIQAEAGFFTNHDRAKFQIHRVNLSGAPAPGQGSWRLYRLNVPSETLLPADQPVFDKDGRYTTPGDQKRSRWDQPIAWEEVMRRWPDGQEVGHGRVVHDEQGAATIELPVVAAGAFRLRYETKDPWGAVCTASDEFIVAGDKAATPLPLVLAVEHDQIQVGQNARLLVHSGLAGQSMVLETFQDGRLKDRRVIRSTASPEIIEIPVTPELRGGFAVSLTTLRDHQLMRLTRTISVPWENKFVDVQFTTFRDRLKPKSRETWSIKVTDLANQNAGIAGAEVLALMFDKTLEALSPYSAVNPLALYPQRASVGQVRSNLGQAGQLWLISESLWDVPGYQSFEPDRLLFIDGYGFGGPGFRNGMMPMSAPMAAAPMKKAMNGSAAPEQSVLSEAKVGKDKEESVSRQESSVVENQDLRTNFAETAFFEPHLLTNSKGEVEFSFTVPDSVTAWKVFVQALTRDVRSGRIQIEAKSVKDLMVRPILPRFVREGDRAELIVIVGNASEREMTGRLNFEMLDAATNASVFSAFGLTKEQVQNRPFRVPAQGSVSLSFAVQAPAKPGLYAVKATASTKDWSDGELRPLPVLPGRMHLAQSRFAVLKDKAVKDLSFPDMRRTDDPSLAHESLVVTVDGQLFYSLVAALPYLVRYPYECTEQTLNRYLAAGMLSAVFASDPNLKLLAQEMSKRTTQFESFDTLDPNRKMTLEETPWLIEAKGGESENTIVLLNPTVAAAERASALAKLLKAQNSNGGFAWFAGGRPSPDMTLYLLAGFAKGMEFGVEVPREPVRRAWGYVYRYYIDEIRPDLIKGKGNEEFATFLAYVLSCYPDTTWTGGAFSREERQELLGLGFKHWKSHSPYLKAMLSLALVRSNRRADAQLVLSSVMDSAKSTEDGGTFWAPESRSWLWYNDTIESHAFILRALLEVDPKHPKLDGLVLWLFMNKKLNQWKSTRATAEVIGSVAKYLKTTGQLGGREAVSVTVGGATHRFNFGPEAFTGKKNQIVVPAERLVPERDSVVHLAKETKGYALASATWHFSTSKLPTEAKGDVLSVSRSLFKRTVKGREIMLEPLRSGKSLTVGDEVEVHLTLTARHSMEYVHVRDPRAAGLEPTTNLSGHKWDLGIGWYEEIRDSATNFFFERLPQGEYEFKYRLRVATAGTFVVAPTFAQPMYAPEFTAYSAGHRLEVTK